MTEAGEPHAPVPPGRVPPEPVPTTGHAAADAAGDRLAEVDEAPLDDHVAIYDDVHRQLQETLADVDDA